MKSGRAALLILLALGVLVAPLAVEAQPGRVPRVGVLTLSVAFATPTLQAFRQELRDQGYGEVRTSPWNSVSPMEAPRDLDQVIE
jgi:hypothetical protein